MTTPELIIDGVFFLLLAYHLVAAIAALTCEIRHCLNRSTISQNNGARAFHTLPLPYCLALRSDSQAPI